MNGPHGYPLLEWIAARRAHAVESITSHGLIAFASLADYEAYRARLKLDDEARANFDFARRERFILREERRFCEVVDETFQGPAW